MISDCQLAPATPSQCVSGSDETVISVDGISKKFCRHLRRSLAYGVRDIATDLVGGRRQSHRLRQGEFWALQEVDFSVRRGEALGLVGANGSGKTTLLRIISGLIKPDTGRVRVRGRVAPLIALGAGFNPILTGRENIYANMSVLGLPTREINKRFEEVIDFAEIHEAIDAPVQTYSSGMAARLGFACAIHVAPDILLIDEVLAVGDIKFKTKCHQYLAQLLEQGTAFILVSHNPYHIINVCSRAIYLSHGRIACSGKATDIIRRYEQDLCLSGMETAVGKLSLPPKSVHESSGLDIVSVSFQNERGDVLDTIKMGEVTRLCIECLARKCIDNLHVSLSVKFLSGEFNQVLRLNSAADNVRMSVRPGRVELRLNMPYCGLIPGVYSMKIFLREGVRTFDTVAAFRFTVETDQNASRCSYYQPRTWTVVNENGWA